MTSQTPLSQMTKSLPDDVLGTIQEKHAMLYMHAQRPYYEVRGMDIVYPRELIEMESLWSDWYDEQDGVFCPRDIDWVEEITECVRVWIATRDSKRVFQGAFYARDVGDIYAMLDALDFDEPEWKRFKAWVPSVLAEIECDQGIAPVL